MSFQNWVHVFSSIKIYQFTTNLDLLCSYAPSGTQIQCYSIMNIIISEIRHLYH